MRFEEYYNCSIGREYHKEVDNYVLRSTTQDSYLLKRTKISLAAFDEKRYSLNEF